jgi:mannose-6-phosphate isomerase class I
LLLLLLLLRAGEVLEIQASSNNTIKGGLTGDPVDKQALVDIVTAGGVIEELRGGGPE